MPRSVISAGSGKRCGAAATEWGNCSGGSAPYMRRAWARTGSDIASSPIVAKNSPEPATIATTAACIRAACSGFSPASASSRRLHSVRRSRFGVSSACRTSTAAKSAWTE